MTGAEVWPWLTIAGLGAFHGLNPAMGWLFAVALGLHRKSRMAMASALPAIAIGHAISIGLVAGAVVALGAVVDTTLVARLSGALLIGWAIYHQVYGHRHRVRIGMQTGLFGLVVWSFLMATAHGAGLMLLPALMPLCVTSAGIAGSSATTATLAVGLHTLAMLIVIAAAATAVYACAGLAILRSGWINFDLLWTGALVATGLLLVALS